MSIFSGKNPVLILEMLLIFLVFNASAQWSPGGTMVYMGDLNLAASHGSNAKSPMMLGSSPLNLPTNNPAQINISSNNTSTKVAPSLPIIDLTRYSKDRANKNLTEYKNIMYPISESRGTTTSTAGGAGGGCGCGG